MPKTVINYESPYVEQDLHTFLADPVTQAFCWKLTPHADSVITDPIGATSHTRDLTLPGHGALVFRHTGGFLEATAVDTESSQESAGLTFRAIFDDDAITPEQLDSGDWDASLLDIYSINYKALKMGQMIEFSGPIGGFSEEGIIFEAQAQPLTALARLKVGRRASANCDVRRYGDLRCKRILTSETHEPVVVTTGASQITFRASALPAALVFTMLNGEVTFTSGLNQGRKGIVRSWDAGTGEITLQKALPHLISNGDEFTAIEGCDRSAPACEARDNIINFRGLRHITNLERFNQIIRV